MRVKVDCKDKPFTSKRELPFVSCAAQSESRKDLLIRLDASVGKDDPEHKQMIALIDK